MESAQFNFIHYGFGQVVEFRGTLPVCRFEVDFLVRQRNGEFQALGVSRRIDDDVGDGF